MAGEGEQLILATAAPAEPEECSRWAVICLLICVGMSLMYIALHMMSNYWQLTNLQYPVAVFLFVSLVLLLGAFLCAMSIIVIQERCSGNPVEERFMVDTMLSF